MPGAIGEQAEDGNRSSLSRPCFARTDYTDPLTRSLATVLRPVTCRA